MSMKENVLVENGTIILKDRFMQYKMLNDYLHEKKKLKKGKIIHSDINFQIEGNTIFHLFATDPDNLALILEHVQENEPRYLAAVMMRNDHGKSPIEIALDSNSKRCINLFLQAITTQDAERLSGQLAGRFPDLIDAELQSFHEYLETCTFQTVQMENMKYIELYDDSDLVLTAHTSCILDQEFMERYTKMPKADPSFVSKKNSLKESLAKLYFEKAQLNREHHGNHEIANEASKLAIHPVGASASVSPTPDDALLGYGIQSEDDLEEDKEFDEGEEEEAEEEESPDNVMNPSSAALSSLPSERIETNLYRAKSDDDLALGGEADRIDHEIMIVRNELKELDSKADEETQNKTLSRYNVYAIEFNWLFDPQGKRFLEALGNSTNMEILSLSIIAQIVDYLSTFYLNRIKVFVFYPFVFHFIVFVFYTTWVNKEKDERDETWTGFGLADFILGMSILIFEAYFMFVIELKKFKEHPKMYSSSFWTQIDWISHILNVFIVIADFAGMSFGKRVPVMAIANLFMWIKLYFFGRLYKSLAGIVRMVFSVAFGIIDFLFVLFIMIMGYACSFYILARNQEEAFTGRNFFDAMIYSYRTGLGDFDTELYGSNPQKFLLYCVWFSSTFIILIILLNMLIAVVSDIFAQVLENYYKNMYKERTKLMIEYDALVNRKKVFQGLKYIIVFSKEAAEEIEDPTTENQLQIIQNSLEKKVKQQDVLLSKIYKNIDIYIKDRLDRKNIDIETKTDQQFTEISSIFDKLENDFNKVTQNMAKRN